MASVAWWPLQGRWPLPRAKPAPGCTRGPLGLGRQEPGSSARTMAYRQVTSGAPAAGHTGDATTASPAPSHSVQMSAVASTHPERRTEGTCRQTTEAGGRGGGCPALVVIWWPCPCPAAGVRAQMKGLQFPHWPKSRGCSAGCCLKAEREGARRKPLQVARRSKTDDQTWPSKLF